MFIFLYQLFSFVIYLIITLIITMKNLLILQSKDKGIQYAPMFRANIKKISNNVILSLQYIEFNVEFT